MTERVEAALVILEQAFEDVARTGLRWFRSELHRGRGEILLSRRPVDFSAAEDAFQAALYEARSQKARSLELRAALSLARLYCASGREQLVPQLVEPVVARFKEEPQFLRLARIPASRRYSSVTPTPLMRPEYWNIKATQACLSLINGLLYRLYTDLEMGIELLAEAGL